MSSPDPSTREIRVSELLDPLSLASREREPRLASSYAGELLARELDRYLRGMVSGLSVLVSGHRGSGKTTLVRGVVEAAYRRALDSPGSRPLLVMLHGPDLLPDPSRATAVTEGEAEPPPAAKGAQPSRETAPAAGNAEGNAAAGAGNGAGAAEAAAGAAGAVKEDTRTQRVLIQITIALYRSLARELAQAYRDQLQARAGYGRGRPDWAELAGRLELELDDAPDPSLLRDFWARAGFLDGGVLGGPPEQGARELVALSTAAQAYRVVSGVYGQTWKRSASDDLERARSLTAEAGAAREVLTTGLGLLAGAAAAAGVLTQGALAGVGAGLAALLAGLTASLAVKYTSSRVQKRSLTSEYTFIRSRSVATLDRELPVLVDRIRAARLAPVFVVDELDKVVDLPERMGALVQHLKHFVTERTFFCFLTDRYYFEHVDVASEANPFPRAHTYFTHRLFVLHRPEALRAYLLDLLKTEGVFDSTQQARIDADREALAYVLLHDARLHPFDLRRNLANVCDADGWVRLAPGAIRTQLGYRYHLAMQLAIEHLLAGEDLRHRLDRDPYFGQLAYDVLYYPARAWEQGRADVDLSAGHLRQYLSERIRFNREEATTGTPGAARSGSPAAPPPPAGAGAGPADEVDQVLSASDFRFLRDQVLELVALMANPDRLFLELTRRARFNVPTPVVQAVPRRGPGLPDPRLLELAEGESYRWRFDTFGRNLHGQRPRTVSSEDIVAADRFIGAVDEFVRELTGGSLGLGALAVEVGVLEQTPDWTRVAAARQRLAAAAGSGAAPYRDHRARADDEIAIDEYALLLEQRGARLAAVLAHAADLGWLAVPSDGDVSLRRAAGLRSLGKVLNLREQSIPARVDAALATIGVTVDEPLPELARADAKNWLSQVRALAERNSPDPDPAALWDAGLATWRERFDRYLTGAAFPFAATRTDVVLHASGVPFVQVLQLELGKMTLTDWSELLLEVLASASQQAGSPAMWLAVPALLRLGFGSRIGRLMNVVRGGADAQDQVNDWLARYGDDPTWTTPRSGALILAPAQESITAAWLPSPRYGALRVPLERFSSDVLLDRIFELLGPEEDSAGVRYVLYEGTDRPPQLKRLSKLRVSWFHLGARPPISGDKTLRTPATLDDAMERVRSMAPEPPGAKSESA